MSKHRTREQKEKPKHPFLVSWEPTFSEPVKMQARVERRASDSASRKYEKAKTTANYASPIDSKREILRSVILASLIFSFEIVLYFLLE